MRKVLILCLLASMYVACVERVPVEVVNLRCENLTEAVLDISNPRLSWEISLYGPNLLL